MSAYQKYNVIFIILRRMWIFPTQLKISQSTSKYSYRRLKMTILHFCVKNLGNLQHNGYAVSFPHFWIKSPKWRFWDSNMSVLTWFERYHKSWARFTCLSGMRISKYNFDMRTFGTISLFSPGVKMWRAVFYKISASRKMSSKGLRNCHL